MREKPSPPAAKRQASRGQGALGETRTVQAPLGQTEAAPPAALGVAPPLLPPDAVESVFERLAAANPAPTTELEHADAFTLLVAVVLSAQATDAGVNKATRGLFAEAPDATRMAALGEDGIRERIKTIGLFRAKARNVHALSEAILREHDGAVPRTREALQALPGVGRKTANVVLNTAFGEPTIAVDTHIYRVAHRLPLARGRTPDHVEAGLERIVPERFKRNAHHWLLLHGRYVCKARTPECWRCGLADLCRYEPKTVGPPARSAVTPTA